MLFAGRVRIALRRDDKLARGRPHRGDRTRGCGGLGQDEGSRVAQQSGDQQCQGGRRRGQSDAVLPTDRSGDREEHQGHGEATRRRKSSPTIHIFSISAIVWRATDSEAEAYSDRSVR